MAAAALREHRVSAFPVLDEASQVIGVVSESDLLAKLALGLGVDGMPRMIAGILRCGAAAAAPRSRSRVGSVGGGARLPRIPGFGRYRRRG
jgi:CBS domain-containing protein